MNRTRLFIELALVLGFLIAVGCALWFSLKSEVLAQNCGAFDSYESALEAFNLGNTHLDGDKDGSPCEFLK